METDRGLGTAFEDFVQARSGALFRTALLLTGRDRASAEDLLQICLERAYRHWGRIGDHPRGGMADGPRASFAGIGGQWARAPATGRGWRPAARRALREGT